MLNESQLNELARIDTLPIDTLIPLLHSEKRYKDVTFSGCCVCGGTNGASRPYLELYKKVTSEFWKIGWWKDKTFLIQLKELYEGYYPTQTFKLCNCTCEHTWVGLTMSECKNRNIQHWGKCYHVQECTKCGHINSYSTDD